MLKAGLVGVLGLACLAGCSSPMSHPSSGDANHAGASAAGDTASAGAGGGDGSGGRHTAGGGDATGGEGRDLPGDPTTPVGFCTGYYALLGELVAKCWGLPQDETSSLFSDPALCSAFISSIDQHRVGFDGSHAAACLNELKTLSCDGATDSANAPDCALLTPLVATGGTCSAVSGATIGNECRDDAFCQAPETYACSGVCTERVPIGAQCNSLPTIVRCVEDATCDSATQKCVPTPPPAALGEACGGTAAGKCANGLWCDRGAGGAAAAGVCSTQKASGACTLAEACERSKICAGAPGAKSCVAAKALGASCTPGNRECSVVSYCGADQKCSNVAAALGQACGTLQGESVPCARGAYCEGGLVGPGVCQTPKAVGASCTGTSLGECAGDRGHCNPTDHTCLACP